MFKVNKLKNVSDEKIIIDYVTQDKYEVGKGIVDSFKTLSFSIEGKIDENEYTLCFDLNCKLEELLKIEPSKSIDFSSYLFNSETYFMVNGITNLDPKIEIRTNRYLKNKFVVLIYFYTDITLDDEIYSGIIEFSFNLDDYLEN
ncbi:MAG: hypothetical protein IJY25_04640 [Bacilli bacterium]|nr:hypothetical protein [Bacilli bacterium]